jgi:GDP-L-fucose synthase
VYPKFAPQPIREEHLLTGELEPTNQWYAIAKIAGIKMAQAYERQYGFRAISLMPTNLYGPGDNSTSLARMSCPRCCENSTRPPSPARRR